MMLMRFVEVDGQPTRYLEAGPRGAPVLLLLHGMTLTCDIWARLADLVSDHHHVIAPDMLGHGFTRPKAVAADVDIGAKVEHLKRFVEAVTDARSYDVCGASYGALVACNLYLADPGRVRRLVLHGSASCFSDEGGLQQSVQRAHATYAALLEASSPQGWREHLASSVFDANAIPDQLPHLLALTYAQPWIHAYWRSTIAAMSDPERFRRYRVLERLESLRVPTLLVWGRDDRGAPIDAVRRELARMPDARLSTIDRCGHFPMFEHPGSTADLTRRFLSQS
jgi:2-hydroxy-6-oxonona-2,4-dienedioate hydrolase